MIVVFQGKKLPANLDSDAEEGDVSDEDTGDEDEEEDDDDDDDNPQASETSKHRQTDRQMNGWMDGQSY